MLDYVLQENTISVYFISKLLAVSLYCDIYKQFLSEKLKAFGKRYYWMKNVHEKTGHVIEDSVCLHVKEIHLSKVCGQ